MRSRDDFPAHCPGVSILSPAPTDPTPLHSSNAFPSRNNSQTNGGNWNSVFLFALACSTGVIDCSTCAKYTRATANSAALSSLQSLTRHRVKPCKRLPGSTTGRQQSSGVELIGTTQNPMGPLPLRPRQRHGTSLSRSQYTLCVATSRLARDQDSVSDQSDGV